VGYRTAFPCENEQARTYEDSSCLPCSGDFSAYANLSQQHRHCWTSLPVNAWTFSAPIPHQTSLRRDFIGQLTIQHQAPTSRHQAHQSPLPQHQAPPLTIRQPIGLRCDVLPVGIEADTGQPPFWPVFTFS
jgi:hypothetical protein